MSLPLIQPGRPLATQDLVFDKIGVVGLGLIGGSIALAARQVWPGALVIGVDNKDVLETAMRLHAIDVAADDLHRPRRGRCRDSVGTRAAECRATRRARRQRPHPGGRDRHRKHEAVDRATPRAACRRDSRLSAVTRWLVPRSAVWSTPARIFSKAGRGSWRQPAMPPAPHSTSCSRLPARLGAVPR